MARIRTIKPEFFTHPKISALSIPARLLFLAILTQADDRGRLRHQPGLIRALAFGEDDAVKVHRLLTELCDAGRLVAYTVDGEKFLSIKNFAEHQVINRPTPSKYPPPPADAYALTESSRNGHGVLTEDSLPERNREQGTGKGKEQGTGKDAEETARFAVFFDAYPRKVKRDEALRIWLAKCPPLDRCLATLDWQRTSRDWTKDGGKFIPYPTTWLTDGQWNDEPPIAVPVRVPESDPYFRP